MSQSVYDLLRSETLKAKGQTRATLMTLNDRLGDKCAPKATTQRAAT